MKTLDFIFIGSPKDKSYLALEEEYYKRIKRYTNSRLITLKDSSEKKIALKNKKETEAILRKLGPGDFLIVCDEHGKHLTSKNMANKIVNWRLDHQRIVFIVGGAYGLDEELLKKANLKLKLSEFTLPHELARVVLLEQTYRAFTIIGGEKYHH